MRIFSLSLAPLAVGALAVGSAVASPWQPLPVRQQAAEVEVAAVPGSGLIAESLALSLELLPRELLPGNLLSAELLNVEALASDEPTVVAQRGVETVATDARGSGLGDLRVPFRTQKDGDRFQGSNCGPAALAMVLAGFGVERTNADLRLLTHTYQGTVGRRGGTALEHMATVGEDFGLDAIGLYTGERFSQWAITDVRDAVLAGRPVVPLVKYRMLPGHEDSGVRFDHYVVVYGFDGDSFLYHDPAYATPDEGGAKWIAMADLDRAMAAASITRQAVAFGRGRS